MIMEVPDREAYSEYTFSPTPSDHGKRVFLSNENLTATRNNPAEEFNHGIVFGSHPIIPFDIFEIKIDLTIVRWNGSLEIGVANKPPFHFSYPNLNTSTLSELQNAWILSGSSVRIDGSYFNEDYSRTSINDLKSGDTVGLYVTDDHDLHFLVNGVDQGVAARSLPACESLYPVIDLYGNCVQVSMVKQGDYWKSNFPPETPSLAVMSKPLAFSLDVHGAFIQFQGDSTISRQNALFQFDNGVCLTSRPLADNEIFGVRITALVSKWTGGLEIGLTTRSPQSYSLQGSLPGTMSSEKSAPVLLLAAKSVLLNGRLIRRNFLPSSLSNLRIGQTIAMRRTTQGELLIYLDAKFIGVAAVRVPKHVYGVVDLYGRAGGCKLIRTLNDDTEIAGQATMSTPVANPPPSVLRLSHTQKGHMVTVFDGGIRAKRKQEEEEYNDAVIFTDRPLCPGEEMSMRIDRFQRKWTGSLCVGVSARNDFTVNNGAPNPYSSSSSASSIAAAASNHLVELGESSFPLPSSCLDLPPPTHIVSTDSDLRGAHVNLPELQVGDLVCLKLGHDKSSFTLTHNSQLVGVIPLDPSPLKLPCSEIDWYGVVDLYGQVCGVTLIERRLHDLEYTLPSSALEGDLLDQLLDQVTLRTAALTARSPSPDLTIEGEGLTIMQQSVHALFNNTTRDHSSGDTPLGHSHAPGHVSNIALKPGVETLHVRLKSESSVSFQSPGLQFIRATFLNCLIKVTPSDNKIQVFDSENVLIRTNIVDLYFLHEQVELVDISCDIFGALCAFDARTNSYVFLAKFLFDPGSATNFIGDETVNLTLKSFQSASTKLVIEKVSLDTAPLSPTVVENSTNGAFVDEQTFNYHQNGHSGVLLNQHLPLLNCGSTVEFWLKLKNGDDNQKSCLNFVLVFGQNSSPVDLSNAYLKRLFATLYDPASYRLARLPPSLPGPALVFTSTNVFAVGEGYTELLSSHLSVNLADLPMNCSSLALRLGQNTVTFLTGSKNLNDDFFFISKPDTCVVPILCVDSGVESVKVARKLNKKSLPICVKSSDEFSNLISCAKAQKCLKKIASCVPLLTVNQIVCGCSVCANFDTKPEPEPGFIRLSTASITATTSTTSTYLPMQDLTSLIIALQTKQLKTCPLTNNIDDWRSKFPSSSEYILQNTIGNGGVLNNSNYNALLIKI